MTAVVGRRRYPYTLLDVFTDVPLEGNGLAVVHDADDLSDETMLRFAREMRLSETTFVQTSSAVGADYRNRIWTITEEIPFAGHPSLGTAVAVARARGAREARYVQQTGVGLQEIDVRIDGDHAFASILQEPAVFGPEPGRAEVMAAVGLDGDDADDDLPPQVVSTGLETLIAPVSKPDAVSRALPDFGRIDALLDGYGARSLYLVACDPAKASARARMFTGSAGVGEDPATGSAAGPLCAYLHRRKRRPRVEVTQGVEMGRPSLLFADLEGDRARVGGSVVAVIDGTVAL
jgi:trans-2,3-dihydro-3-hydroxyanthranilate isomerase